MTAIWQMLQDYVSTQIMVMFGGAFSAWLIGIVLRKIPKEKIIKNVSDKCEKVGVVITLGLSKWKWTAKAWNVTMEPFFVDFLRNIVIAGLDGLIKGMESDNQKKEK